jgi:hypothetical protein
MPTRSWRLLAPGYYVGPSWSVKDLIAHLGTWMSEARFQLLNIAARSYVQYDVDVEGRNASTLAATKAEPWERVWAWTNGARAWMLEAWWSRRRSVNPSVHLVRDPGSLSFSINS